MLNLNLISTPASQAVITDKALLFKKKKKKPIKLFMGWCGTRDTLLLPFSFISFWDSACSCLKVNFKVKRADIWYLAITKQAAASNHGFYLQVSRYSGWYFIIKNSIVVWGMLCRCLHSLATLLSHITTDLIWDKIWAGNLSRAYPASHHTAARVRFQPQNPCIIITNAAESEQIQLQHYYSTLSVTSPGGFIGFCYVLLLTLWMRPISCF